MLDCGGLTLDAQELGILDADSRAPQAPIDWADGNPVAPELDPAVLFGIDRLIRLGPFSDLAVRRFLLGNHFLKRGMGSADLILSSHPLPNIEPIFAALTVPTADAAVVDRRIGCITSARADAHRSDSVAVHVRKCDQVIDHRADVFRPDVRVL